MDNEKIIDSINETNTLDNNTSKDDYESLIKDLLDKDKQKSNNIIEQRNIINKSFEQNRELVAQVDSLRKELEELKAKQQIPNESSNHNSELIKRLESLESYYEQDQMNKEKSRLLDVFQVFKDAGISKDDTEVIRENIINKYGVDVYKHNADTARVFIQDLFRNNEEPNYTPSSSGNYNNYQNNVETNNNQAWVDYINEGIANRKAELEELKLKLKKR